MSAVIQLKDKDGDDGFEFKDEQILIKKVKNGFLIQHEDEDGVDEYICATKEEIHEFIDVLL